MTPTDRIAAVAQALRGLSRRFTLGGHELVRICNDLEEIAAIMSAERAAKVAPDTIARASASANQVAKEAVTRFREDMTKKAAEIDIGENSKFRTSSRFRED